MNNPQRYFNESAWVDEIEKRHSAIRHSNYPYKVVYNKALDYTTLILCEIEKAEIGENIDTQTGEIKQDNKDYFSFGYVPIIKTPLTDSLPFIPDGITEFSIRYRINYFFIVIKSLFESALYYDICDAKVESSTFKAFIGKIKELKKKQSRWIQNGNDKIRFTYSNRYTKKGFTFYTTLDTYDWRQYFEHDDFLSQCQEFSTSSKLSLRDLYNFYYH